MKNFEKIRTVCEENSKISAKVIDEFYLIMLQNGITLNRKWIKNLNLTSIYVKKYRKKQ